VASVCLAAAAAGIAGSAPARAGTHPSHVTFKCRAQAYSYTMGKTHVLNSAKGPRVRAKVDVDQTLSDNRIVAKFGKHDQAKFFDVETNYDTTQKWSHLRSVTLYPTKGKKQTFKIGKPAYNYKHDMTRQSNQVQLPTTGSTGQGRYTPKLKKVVVKAQENCYDAP
jgi:hypothetical protein